MNWNMAKEYIGLSFEKLPNDFQEVWVDTNHGIFKAKYDSSQFGGRCDYFDIEAPPVWGGYTVKSWMPFSSNQPERSKREDLDYSKRIEQLEYFRDIIIDERISLGEWHKDYDDYIELFNELIEESKMRCSELQRKPGEVG